MEFHQFMLQGSDSGAIGSPTLKLMARVCRSCVDELIDREYGHPVRDISPDEPAPWAQFNGYEIVQIDLGVTNSPSFGRASCDGCGSLLAGDRYKAYVSAWGNYGEDN